MDYQVIERVGNPFRKIKPIQWLVEGHLERGAMGLMFGPPASGKSFIASSLACAVASGTPWFGHKVMPTTVLYIAGEGLQGILRRFAAWSRMYDVDLSEAPLYRSLQAMRIGRAGSALGVVHAVNEVLEGRHRLPGLIVIDTLARNFDAGDENSTKDMSAFIREIDETFCKGLKATVLIVHHSGHTVGRARGSSALTGAVDHIFEVTKEGAWMTLSNIKAKETEVVAPKQFEIQTVDLGVYEPSLEEIEASGAIGAPCPVAEPVFAGVISLMDNPMVLVAGYTGDGFKVYCRDIVEMVMSGWHGIKPFCEQMKCTRKAGVQMLWTCVGYNLLKQEGKEYCVTAYAHDLWLKEGGAL